MLDGVGDVREIIEILPDLAKKEENKIKKKHKDFIKRHTTEPLSIKISPGIQVPCVGKLLGGETKIIQLSIGTNTQEQIQEERKANIRDLTVTT